MKSSFNRSLYKAWKHDFYATARCWQNLLPSPNSFSKFDIWTVLCAVSRYRYLVSAFDLWNNSVLPVLWKLFSGYHVFGPHWNKMKWQKKSDWRNKKIKEGTLGPNWALTGLMEVVRELGSARLGAQGTSGWLHQPRCRCMATGGLAGRTEGLDGYVDAVFSRCRTVNNGQRRPYGGDVTTPMTGIDVIIYWNQKVLSTKQGAQIGYPEALKCGIDWLE